MELHYSVGELICSFFCLFKSATMKQLFLCVLFACRRQNAVVILLNIIFSETSLRLRSFPLCPTVATDRHHVVVQTLQPPCESLMQTSSNLSSGDGRCKRTFPRGSIESTALKFISGNLSVFYCRNDDTSTFHGS